MEQGRALTDASWRNHQCAASRPTTTESSLCDSAAHQHDRLQARLSPITTTGHFIPRASRAFCDATSRVFAQPRQLILPALGLPALLVAGLLWPDRRCLRLTTTACHPYQPTLPTRLPVLDLESRASLLCHVSTRVIIFPVFCFLAPAVSPSPQRSLPALPPALGRTQAASPDSLISAPAWLLNVTSPVRRLLRPANLDHGGP